MLNKSRRLNVMPAFAALASTTYTSQVEQNTWGRGVRLYVKVASAANSGGTESISLCALPPVLSESPTAANLIPLIGFSAATLLTNNGTWCFDFYPGNWMPSAGVAASGALLGAAGVTLPMQWGVRIVLPAGSHATITVDAEILP